MGEQSQSAPVPLVSVIVPCRNEVGFITKCLESILSNDYPHDRLEILVADGMSDDGTRDLVRTFEQHFPTVLLLDNWARSTPAALNLGIKRAKGEIIVRMDAHCLYPSHYISKLVGWLIRSGADNVGGLWVTRPACESATARAIAIALSHPFGVGNAHYRIGLSSPRWVDTVPFGCYRRDVFERVGMFDEDMLRNQDDEFNHRLLGCGGRILLVPDIVADYYARDSLGKLARMCFQYGYFKPLAARKLRRVVTVRQVVPALFVGTLLISGSLAPWSLAMKVVFVITLCLYTGTAIAASAMTSFRRRAHCFPQLCLAFAVMHASYGYGYLKGLLDFVALRRRPRRITDTR